MHAEHSLKGESDIGNAAGGLEKSGDRLVAPATRDVCHQRLAVLVGMKRSVIADLVYGQISLHKRPHPH